MENKYYTSPKSTALKRFFWKAAGADRYLLERSTYSDQIKYFCLGGIVVATGLMAGIAGGYAFYTIFEPSSDALSQDTHTPTVIKSIIFGIVWGLIIYNIDRFIVTSTGKGDGTEAITRQEIKSAIPRLIMGIIIALTISKPVEIRMFQKEIEASLQTEQEIYMENQRVLIQAKYDSTYLADIDEKRAIVRTKEADLRSDIAAKQAEMDAEEAKCPPGSGSMCRGPEWHKLEKQKANLEAQLPYVQADVQKELAELDSAEANVVRLRDNDLANAKIKAQNMGGLAKRIHIAHEEAGFWISLFITLLFMVIELTPIFFKMMLIKGPYDYMDENTRELARAELGIEIEYDFYKDKEGVDKHKVTNHAAEVMRNEKIMILKAQDELNEKIIQKWKESESKKIDENPDDYITNE